MLATGTTGLGVLQKPLRELYFKYRQAGANPDPSRQRFLTMSSRGMTMRWQAKPGTQPTEVFYAMPSILFWDAVQFIVVRGTKKLCGAFEPLDNDHSRNKDNLFTVLEKKYHFLQQMAHPPLFACVLRRTEGVKALDVHAFVCSSDEEALGLIQGLNAIQNSYNEHKVSETGAFAYRPWTGGGGVVTGGSQNDSVSGLGAPSAAGGGPGARPRAPLPDLQHLVAQNAVAAAAVARETQPGSPTKQQHGIITGQQHKALSQSQEHISHQLQSNSSATPADRPRVINLTQEDFQNQQQQQQYQARSPEPAASPGWTHSNPGASPIGASRISRISEDTGSRSERDQDEHVYHYIQTIDNNPNTVSPGGPGGAGSRAGVTPTRPVQDSRGFSPSNFKGALLVTSLNQRDRHIPQSQQGTSAVQSPTQGKDYQSMTRSIDLLEDTISPTALRPSQIAARFEQRAKSTAAVPPQPSSAGQLARTPSNKAVSGPEQGKLGQGYSFLSSGSGNPQPLSLSDRRSDYENQPLSSYPSASPQPYRSGSPGPHAHRSSSPGYDRELPQDSSLPRNASLAAPSAFYSNQEGSAQNTGRNYINIGANTGQDYRAPSPRDNRPPSPRDKRQPSPRDNNRPPSRLPERSYLVADAQIVQQQTAYQPPQRQPRISPFDRSRGQEPVTRPVAKVPPHKVSGGIQVLPSHPVLPMRGTGSNERPTGRVSPLDNINKAAMHGEFQNAGPPPRRAKSQYFDEHSFSEGSYGAQEKHDYESNWQFNRNAAAENARKKAQKTKEQDTDKNMSEKLLLSKKKDAEIASVMQNLHFDYDSATVTPGVPAGNNFEKSLGYFP